MNQIFTKFQRLNAKNSAIFKNTKLRLLAVSEKTEKRIFMHYLSKRKFP